MSFFRIRNVTLNHSFHYLSLDLQNANSFCILCQFSEALDHQLTLPRALITASCYLVGHENGVSISSSPPDVTTTPLTKPQCQEPSSPHSPRAQRVLRPLGQDRNLVICFTVYQAGQKQVTIATLQFISQPTSYPEVLSFILED